MKVAVIIVRILMGLLLLFSSIVFFFKLVPVPELTGTVKLFNEGLEAASYLLPLIKGIELLCAIAFISGRFVTLATVVIFPIIINIFLFQAFLAPEGLPASIFLLVGDLFLAHNYRKNYSSLLVAK